MLTHDRFGALRCGALPLSAFPSGNYGGCGTFFGLTNDPVKRACYLEKKLAKSQAKCAAGKEKHCTKASARQAELATIAGFVAPGVGQPTAADLMYAQQQSGISMGILGAQQTEESALQRFLPILGVGLVGLLGAWVLFEVI
jgi:hypothetical protein